MVGRGHSPPIIVSVDGVHDTLLLEGVMDGYIQLFLLDGLASCIVYRGLCIECLVVACLTA